MPLYSVITHFTIISKELNLETQTSAGTADV
jgi:hypothetical protein